MISFFLQITGLPESAQPKIKIQLSSPIESKTITKIYDPLDNENDNKAVEGSGKDGEDEEKKNDATSSNNEANVDEDDKGNEGEGEGEKVEETEEKEVDEEDKDELDEEAPETSEASEVNEEEDETNNEEEGEMEEKEGKDEEKIEETKKESSLSSTSIAIFKGVDISVATLTMDVSDLDIPLGSSAVYDVGPLCEIDVLGGISKRITELEVAIVPDDDGVSNVENKEGDVVNESEHFQDAVSEEGETGSKTEEVAEIEESQDEEKVVDEAKTEEVDEAQDEEATEITEEAESDDTHKEEVVDTDIVEEEKTSIPEKTSSVIVPTCILHFKIEYNASVNDQKLILSEKYNAAVARQAVAVEKLRKIAISARRAQMAAAASSGTSENKKPAVKPGFLDKKPNKKEPMFLVRWYEKTIGPKSLLRQVYPIAKNYVLFFAGIFLMHYQGHQLALPPPV